MTENILKKLGAKPNILLTSKRNEENLLIKSIEGSGKFVSTDFRDVIIGKVKNREKFLQKLNSGIYPSLSRTKPVDKTIQYSEKNLIPKIFGEIQPFIEKIQEKDTFKVSFTRRGLKEKISSQEVEEKLGEAVFKKLKKQGKKPEVDLEKPDKTILLESLEKTFLAGFISKKQRKKYRYLKFL